MRDLDFTPQPWMEHAACAHIRNPDLFFPTESGGLHQRQVNAAKALCSTCPVTTDCLQRALDLHPTEGIWGGTTEQERRQMHPTRHRKACA